MKSFRQYIEEDIEILPVERENRVPIQPADVVHRKYTNLGFSHRVLGEIHPGYDVHHYKRIRKVDGMTIGRTRKLFHIFNIVHRGSGNIAGDMQAWGGKLHPTKGVVKGAKGKGLKVVALDMHSDHTSRKVGTSLPVELYRHLHRSGYAIQSDKMQSQGAAHVWNIMRNDPELKKHMMAHIEREPNRGERHTFIKRAHRVPESSIWFSPYRREPEDKVRTSRGEEPDETTTLVLSGKKRKRNRKE